MCAIGYSGSDCNTGLNNDPFLFSAHVQPFAKKDARTAAVVSLASVCAMRSATASCVTSATLVSAEPTVKLVTLFMVSSSESRSRLQLGMPVWNMQCARRL
jgi:hypothetical protein